MATPSSRPVLLSALFLVGGLAANARDEIPLYDNTQPRFHHLWSRVGDVSPKLQAVETTEISPDGKWVASGGKFGYSVMLWRAADGALIWERKHDSEVEAVVFSPDGGRLASGGEDYQVRIWDTATGEQIASLTHPTAIDGITWSHDGRTIASGAEDGRLYLWDGDTYEQLAAIRCGDTINSLQFTADDTRIFVAGNLQIPNDAGTTTYRGFAQFIDLDSGEVLREFGPFEASKKSGRISPDESLLATAGFDNKVHVFDAASGDLVQEIPLSGKLEAVVFAPDGRMLLAAGKTGHVECYRVPGYELVARIPCPDVEYIDFDATGRFMVTGHEDSGLVMFYLLETQLLQDGDYQRLQNAQLHNRDLQ